MGTGIVSAYRVGIPHLGRMQVSYCRGVLYITDHYIELASATATVIQSYLRMPKNRVKRKLPVKLKLIKERDQ